MVVKADGPGYVRIQPKSRAALLQVRTGQPAMLIGCLHDPGPRPELPAQASRPLDGSAVWLQAHVYLGLLRRQCPLSPLWSATGLTKPSNTLAAASTLGPTSATMGKPTMRCSPLGST